MASQCVVPIVELKNVREHPNASLLGLADVLGYQMIVALVEDPDGAISRWFLKDKRDEKGKRVPVLRSVTSLNLGGSGKWVNLFYIEDKDGVKTRIENENDVEEIKFSFRHKEGQLCVYFPADVLIPAEWADRFGVRQLLKGKDKDRVGKIKLRGEPSFGLVVDIPEGQDWKVGDNAAEFFGAKKYEPPIRVGCGDAAPHDSRIDPYFEKFTDVQNGRIFTDVFKDGEEVVFTEKIHGTNARIGLVAGQMVAGSMEAATAGAGGRVESGCATPGVPRWWAGSDGAVAA